MLTNVDSQRFRFKEAHVVPVVFVIQQPRHVLVGNLSEAKAVPSHEASSVTRVHDVMIADDSNPNGNTRSKCTPFDASVGRK